MSDANDPLEAWRSVLAQGQQAFQNYVSQLYPGSAPSQFADGWSKVGASHTGAAPDIANLYLASCDHFFGMTRAFMEQMSLPASSPAPDPRAQGKKFAADFEQWFAPGAAAGNTAFAQGLQWPGAGATSEAQKLWQSVMELTQRLQSLQTTLADTWAATGREAAQQFGAQLATAQAAGKDFAGLKPLYDAWIDNAEKAYSKQAHQEAYAQLLGDLTNTVNELKSKQRELIETWSRQFGLPTRSELDAVHLRMKEMQRELRELQAAIAAKRVVKARRAAPTPVRP